MPPSMLLVMELDLVRCVAKAGSEPSEQCSLTLFLRYQATEMHRRPIQQGVYHDYG